jgi:hypothetical protein
MPLASHATELEDSGVALAFTFHFFPHTRFTLALSESSLHDLLELSNRHLASFVGEVLKLFEQHFEFLALQCDCR